MGIRAFRGDNGLSDVCMMALTTMCGKFTTKEIKFFIEENCRNMIYYSISDKKFLNYFDFDIKIDKFGDSLEIIANNVVTALWFINEWPFEPDYIMKKNIYLTDDGYYKFDGRTKKLKFYEKT